MIKDLAAQNDELKEAYAVLEKAEEYLINWFKIKIKFKIKYIKREEVESSDGSKFKINQYSLIQ